MTLQFFHTLKVLDHVLMSLKAVFIIRFKKHLHIDTNVMEAISENCLHYQDMQG